VGRNNNQTGRGHRRWIVLLGVAGVHLLALWLVSLTLKFRAGQTSDAPAMLWVQISAEAVPPPVPRLPASRPALRPTIPAGPIALPPPVPATAAPDAAAEASAFVDWTAAGQRATRDLLAQQAREQTRLARMGAAPFSNFNAWQATRRANRTPKFPGTRPPLSRWFDFDTTSFVATISLGSRCKVVTFFFLVAGFGCTLNKPDPNAVPGDLFDRKYRVPPLEIPPALTDPIAGDTPVARVAHNRQP
jgi:hypothetical protein